LLAAASYTSNKEKFKGTNKYRKVSNGKNFFKKKKTGCEMKMKQEQPATLTLESN
jgi:hypothetical protein